MRIVAICTLALGLTACAGVDTSGRLASGLERARGASDALLARKSEAELELMRESAGLAQLLREEARRLDRAKCHAGLPALRAYAAAAAGNRAALAADCGLEVEPGAARLRIE